MSAPGGHPLGFEFVEETLRRCLWFDPEDAANADMHEHYWYVGFTCGCRLNVEPRTGNQLLPFPCREHREVAR